MSPKDIDKCRELIAFEEAIADSFRKKQVRGPIHLSGGNEERLVHTFKDIAHTDWVFSTWRNHYHALLKGIAPSAVRNMILEGRSMTLSSVDHKFLTSSIVGGMIPIAVGVAYAIRKESLTDWVWCFLGDMAAETGIAHECFKYSAGHDLPITFIVEDNGLSTNAPTAELWGGANRPKVRRYTYERIYPHTGVGTWVKF